MAISKPLNAAIIDAMARAIRNSERILVGAGAGFSAAAGLDYADAAYHERDGRGFLGAPGLRYHLSDHPGQ